MQYRNERNFLKSLCKGHINDLIDEVGWDELQCNLIKKRYLEFKSKTRVCMEEHLSESKYTKEFNTICKKLQSYLIHNKDTELYEMFCKFSRDGF